MDLDEKYMDLGPRPRLPANMAAQIRRRVKTRRAAKAWRNKWKKQELLNLAGVGSLKGRYRDPTKENFGQLKLPRQPSSWIQATRIWNHQAARAGILPKGVHAVAKKSADPNSPYQQIRKIQLDIGRPGQQISAKKALYDTVMGELGFRYGGVL